MRYIIEVELELPVGEEGLTDEGWAIATDFDKVIDKLQDDYGWRNIIIHSSMPKRKNTTHVHDNSVECDRLGH